MAQSQNQTAFHAELHRDFTRARQQALDNLTLNNAEPVFVTLYTENGKIKTYRCLDFEDSSGHNFKTLKLKESCFILQITSGTVVKEEYLVHLTPLERYFYLHKITNYSLINKDEFRKQGTLLMLIA